MVLVKAIVLGVVVWFVLMFVSTNLVGLLAAGLVTQSGFESAQLEDLTATGPRHGLILIGCVLILAFLFLIGRFLSPLFAVAAVMLMISRVPDLIWEIENGRKIRLADIPRTRFSYAITILSWLALPLSCYGVYTLLI